MKIILIRAPFIEIFSGAPIGLAYIQAELKKQGHEVKVFDFSFDVNNHFRFTCGQFTRNFVLDEKHPAIPYAYKQLERYCGIVLAEKPNLVGFHLSYSTFDYSITMAKRIRQAGIPVIVGGPDATYRAAELMKMGLFQAIVTGYGEEAVRTAVNLKSPVGIYNVPLDQDKDYRPDYSGIEFTKYGGKYPLLTTRGCPHNCTFCSQHLRYHYHKVDTVVEQVSAMPDGCGILLNDSNFNVNPKRTKEVLGRMSQVIGKRNIHGFGIEISNQFPLYAEEFARCNFVEARIGIESGSESVRTEMRKPRFTNDAVREMVRRVTACGATVWAQFIFCYPSETDTDREETLELMHQLAAENPTNKLKIYWFRFIVHHGTEQFFKERYGVVPHTIRDWTSPNYTPGKVVELAAKLKARLPKNANIHL
jgi:magnesium-protoporphyrin IX monomethyl ester (oxidative) cyclase